MMLSNGKTFQEGGFMKIATAAVYVESQPEALKFWTEKVGLVVRRKQRMSENASWIEVGGPDAETCLVLFPNSMRTLETLLKRYPHETQAVVRHARKLC